MSVISQYVFHSVLVLMSVIVYYATTCKYQCVCVCVCVCVFAWMINRKVLYMSGLWTKYTWSVGRRN